ncbi:PREDICTED: sodium/glucose cotransporter 4-like [Branchiostoma belcheri]|uniref:Sodium/glucose cotransporter 4-like n=1 Tax=Branchiostoma belcheri TaxID=7741 RepID=A0A6P4Y970_BRABE|nr:PREDICTED: sodium/glucose cotransporter 4-like [Branchiostoma belcheri]
MAGVQIEVADIVIIVLYFVLVLAVGLWSMWRSNRGSVKGYFLAGKNMWWFPVGASLFASNIGSEHFVGLAGTGAAAGIAVGQYEWNSLFIVLLLGWVFVPIYISAGVYTMPEYLTRRFGGQRLRTYLATLSLFLYIFTKISVNMYAGAVFVQQALDWDQYLSIIVLLAVTAVYTILGGLKAVIYTDTFQVVVMVIGGFILMIISFLKVGGMSGLAEKYFTAVPVTNNTLLAACGAPKPDAFHLFRPADDMHLPWPGALLGITALATWYWCTDQVIVQRSLSAKNIHHAKAGSIVCGYLKILPVFMMVFPGMISRALFPDEVACVDPAKCMEVCRNPVGCSNIAYPKLVIELMPTGLRGLMLAVMMAALMSSLTSIFNSGSAVFTIDIWKRVRKQASERELMLVGRLLVLVMVGVSIVWIPILQGAKGAQLYQYLQLIQAVIGPPICCAFVLAVAWKRINEPGTFWGLMAGLAVGLVRLIMEFAYGEPGCGEPDLRPAILSKVHFLHCGIIVFLVTFIVTVVVSLLTKPIPDEKLLGLTWSTMSKEEEKEPTELQTVPSDDLENADEKNELPVDQEEKWNMEIDPKYNARQTEDEAPPKWLRVYDFICGTTSSEADQSQQAMPTIKEDPFWRRVLNINAIFCITVGVFLFGFFF